MSEQICRDCDEPKPLDAEHYSRDVKSATGFRRICRLCDAKRPRARGEAQRAHAMVTMLGQADRNLATVTIRDAPTDAEYEALYAHIEQADALRTDLMPTQESTTFAAPDDGLPIMLAYPTDFHGGASGVRYDLFRRDMEWIRDADGCYAICIGDVIENVKPQSKAGTALYHAAFPNPAEQIRYIAMRMRIAKGKWVALCQGNHDAWDGKWAGIDRLPDLARDLGCPYFSEAGGTVMVEVGAQRYVVVVKHEFAGASRLNTTNAQRRAFDDFPQWESADVLACGHLHFNDVQQPPRKGGYTTYLRGGTYKTSDPYSQAKGFTPEYGVPTTIFYPDTHDIVAFRGNHFERALRFLASEREYYRTRRDDWQVIPITRKAA